MGRHFKGRTKCHLMYHYSNFWCQKRQMLHIETERGLDLIQLLLVGWLLFLNSSSSLCLRRWHFVYQFSNAVGFQMKCVHSSSCAGNADLMDKDEKQSFSRRRSIAAAAFQLKVKLCFRLISGKLVWKKEGGIPLKQQIFFPCHNTFCPVINT